MQESDEAIWYKSPWLISAITILFGATFVLIATNFSWLPANAEWPPLKFITPLFPFVVGLITGYSADRARVSSHSSTRGLEAIKMMQFWYQTNLDNNGKQKSIDDLLVVLSEADCEAVEHGQQFRLAAIYSEQLGKVLKHQDAKYDPEIDQKTSAVIVSGDESKYLRGQLTEYSNLMEIVASAYVNHVADSGMMFREFYYVFFRSERFVLGKFIDATERYPALKRLREEFHKERVQNIMTKKMVT